METQHPNICSEPSRRRVRSAGLPWWIRILPALPTARELALFLNPLTLMTFGQSILGCLQPWLLYCMVLLVITSWAFKDQSDISTDCLVRLPSAWLRSVCLSTTLVHRGNDFQFMMSGNHISDTCRLFPRLFFLRGSHLFLHVESWWGTYPVSCHCCSGRQLPTDKPAAVRWLWLAVCLLRSDHLLWAQLRSRDVAFSQPHCCSQGILKALLPPSVVVALTKVLGTRRDFSLTEGLVSLKRCQW